MKTFPPPRLLLDAGALIAAERDPRSKITHDARVALRGHRPVLVPTVVLAQVWRDRASQHGLKKLCRACHMLGFSESMARRVGSLLRVSGTSDIVDAAVVLTAIEHNAIVLTSDPQDIGALAEAAQAEVRLITV